MGRMTVPIATLLLAPAGNLLAETAAWFENVSQGRCQLKFVVLSIATPLRPLVFYHELGGKGRWPRNSQALAADLLARLDFNGASCLRACQGKLLLITPDGFLPHTWHIPQSGLGEGNILVRRYAVTPANAGLGPLAHELGHLVFDWPDLTWEPTADSECLMARGAAGNRASDPAPPCAPLLVRAGWRDPVPITRELAVQSLGSHQVGYFSWEPWSIWVEKRETRGPQRLLAFATNDRNPAEPPRLLARLPFEAADGELPLLSLFAIHLRRLRA